MYNIASPISHLFKIDSDALMITNHSDSLECRDHSPSYGIEKQKLFHCELQPIHNLSQVDFDYISKIKNDRPELELISFHMASCYDAPKIENKIFIEGGKKYSEQEMIENAKINFKSINEIIGPKIKIAVENNNFFNTKAYEIICNPLFINKIVEENDIYLLFDIAHAQVAAFNMGWTYNEYVSKLPFQKMIQLHICKSGIEGTMAYDAHFLPDENEFDEIERLIKTSKNLKYFTVEYYQNPLLLKEVLVKLKKLLIRYE